MHAKTLRRFPNDFEVRLTTFLAKKRFTSAIKRKKHAYKLSIINKMKQTGFESPKKYWKLLDRLNTKAACRSNDYSNIDMPGANKGWS